MARPHALIVDDEPDIRELISLTLDRMDVACVAVGDLAEARGALERERFDLCLTDMRLPDGDGLDLVAWMQTETPGVPVAVITAHGNVESAVNALKAGAFDFVSKPVELEVLRKLVRTALKLERTTPGATSADSTRLIGDSGAMQKVRATVSKVARSQAPVLITGESGTGKELVARMVHDASPRSAGPFVPVNCGAIPSELMESEFFGHRKGSFTGAHADKDGLFQAAEGGTLFLDEIAELPVLMQVKLLRAIQEKAVRPVGAPQEVQVDVRVLSATHKDLAAEVTAGRFREDLYYRINVIELHVPPLRDRPGDIELLIDHLLDALSEKLGMDPLNIDADARRKLADYRFPGNVRELENVLERAATLCEDSLIEADDVQLRTQPRGPGEDASLPGYLEDQERERILEALEATRWNRTKAAERLGITFRALRYRIKKWGLDQPD